MFEPRILKELREHAKATECKGEMQDMSKGLCVHWLFENLDLLYDGYTVNVGDDCYAVFRKGQLIAGMFGLGLSGQYYAYLTLCP